MFDSTYIPFKPCMLVRRIRKTDNGTLVSGLCVVHAVNRHTVDIVPLEIPATDPDYERSIITVPPWAIALDCDLPKIERFRPVSPAVDLGGFSW